MQDEANSNSDEPKGSQPDIPVLGGTAIESQKSFGELKKEKWEEIEDDVYNMFFLSRLGGQAFWFAIYVFALKLIMFTFLIRDAIAVEQPKDVGWKVQLAQFFMLPVAVSIQSDLMAFYFLIANVMYTPLIKRKNPHASHVKFHVANLCRGIDGMYSLLVNFVVLMRATNVLAMFLNFAALMFVQSIDNMALKLCKDGYLTEDLEECAKSVLATTLPRQNKEWLHSMDSILFLSTFLGVLIAWGVIAFEG